MRHLVLTPLAALAVIALAACRPVGQPGDACTVTGDGFTRKDSCATMCVNWEVTCPSGAIVTPDVCAGELCAGGAGCPSGFACHAVDSVPANARCLPVEVCGGLPGAPGLPEGGFSPAPAELVAR